MASPLPDVPPEAPRLAQIGTWFVLAGVGGGVKYVAAVIKSPERVSNRHFLSLLAANVFISSFCGLMGGLLMTTFTKDSTWTYLASGLFGYLGTQGLDYLMLALKRKIEPGAVLSAVIPVPPGVDSPGDA